MTSSLLEEKKTKRKLGKRIAISLLAFVVVFSLIAMPLKQAKAQIPVTDAVASAWSAGTTIWNKLQAVLKVLWQKVGSIAFQQVLRSALNKIAYDSANYIGSGGQGQKPLFITQDWGAYLAQVGDEAAGQFVESFVNNLNAPVSTQEGKKVCFEEADTCGNKCLSANAPQKCYDDCDKAENACYDRANATGTSTGAVSENGMGNGATPSFNVCQPSSLMVKVTIGLGLVQETRPQAPTCTATQMVNNWTSAAQRLTDFQDPKFLDKFKGIFDPTANDLGIYMLAKTDMSSQAIVDTENSKTAIAANKGWLDVRDIAGNSKNPPGTAEQEAKDAADNKKSQFGKTTGDILVDAANVFLNQLAMSAFNNLMQNLGKKASDASNAAGSNLLTNPNSDVTILYGESNLKESTQTLLQPNFGTRADYDVLSQLAVCPDANNPGPTDCVIDTQFLQAVSEKQTVAEAIKSGYLHSDWQLTSDTQASAYSLRNLSILRQYRILPVGWEVAVQKAYVDPVHPKKVTLSDLISCFDPNDNYNQFSAAFNINDQGWCQGLVDPNWVLKAPLNYCARQGVGSQIQSRLVTPGIKGQAGTADTLSQLSVTRTDGYCGDQKTCVKEKANGSCDAYGYCNEEKRIWSFGADSCDPIYNTCQTFTKTSDGQAYSYLQNTLNYSGCDASSAGCRQYSWFGAYSTSTGAVAWEAAKSVYLNKNAGQCRSADEGCSEFIRVKPTWGANLVMDADFVNDGVGASSTASDFLNDWPIWSSGLDPANRRATIVDAGSEPGGASGKAIKLSATGPASGQMVLSIISSYDRSLLPANFQTIPGQSYTLSADVYLAAGDHAYVVLGNGNDDTVATTTVKNNWQHLSATRLASAIYNQADFNVHADSNSGGPVVFYVKNVKFEMSNWDTGYSSYGVSRFTEKILPPYLEKTCYQDATAAVKDYRLKSGAPAICSNYSRKCNAEEVGCELYTDAGGFSVPAKTTSADYCPVDCLGYDVYISRATYFNSPQAENMIPAKATACSAQAVGCNEFTNLDQVAQGGEQKEYYSYLKQCIKPSQGTCGNFYSWESEAGGPQLKNYNLKTAASGAPETTADDSALCNATIYNLSVSDPDYNPDCRQFYNSAGQISYHLASYIITCSDNCHAYRMTQINQDKALTQAQCAGQDRHWDINNNICDVCLNAGLWNTDHEACVYQAIPGEGMLCSASDNGCREYNGSTGHNTRLSAYYDYENGLNGWYSNCSGGVAVSAISNNKNGHSLQYNPDTPQCLAIGENAATNSSITRQPLIKNVLAVGNAAAQLRVGNLVSQGLSYTAKFLARTDTDANLQIYFLNKDTGAKAYFNAGTPLTVQGGGDWQIYSANLPELDHSVGANEILIIMADKKIYLDDFTLTEIIDRYYLIQNSSLIPNVCYYDTFGNYQGADFNLGCSQYTDRDNLRHNLHKFSQLCSDSAVGCEQMVATNNYAPYKSGIWNDTNNNGSCDADEPDCVKVAGDTALYAVYDATKLCNAVDLGCSRLGQKQATGDWSDTFYKNNPNNYDQSLCGPSAVGCEEWKNGDNTLSYFRDPGNNVCAYRTSQDPAVNGKAWYKIPVKRCDKNANGTIDGTEKIGATCHTDTDCGFGTGGTVISCVTDNNDYPCGVTYSKTIGLGGAGNQVATPSDAAGLCLAPAAGCTEYIDPVSQFSPDLVYNADYKNGGEGWNGQQQTIKLDPNKLYLFMTQSATGLNSAAVKLDFLSGIKPLLIDNTLGTTTSSLTIPAGPDKHILFSSLGNTQALVTGGAVDKTINVKETALAYQLAANVDKKSCNGSVKFDNGCVLFNERSYGPGGVADLSSGWDAFKTLDGQPPAACDANTDGSCTANQLIKVRPDRVCSKWLDCVTYVKDPTTGARTCYALGECTRLDDKGECANFENSTSTAPSLNDISGNKNADGYFLVNDYYPSNMIEVGLNTDAHFDFEDAVPALSCVRANGAACTFNKNIDSDLLVREPEGAPTDYPAHGASYLKVPAGFMVSPQSPKSKISTLVGRDYYLNYLVSTKNAGANAKITIEFWGAGASPIASTSTIVSAPSGWDRKILRFTPIANSFGIRIKLSSDATSSGPVYFDDLNIEPVLQTGPNKYVARECRLYPASDSLTCVSKNNNTITDGWEGYCLQHDPDNLGNCLLWYPVDRISSTQTGRAGSGLGYSGKYPLSYCTEISGNFDLVEKRTEQLVAVAGGDGCYNNITTCYYSSDVNEIGTLWGWWRNNGSPRCNIVKSSGSVVNFCGSRGPGRYWLLEENRPGGMTGDQGGLYFFCEPAYLDDPTKDLSGVHEQNPKSISARMCSEAGGDRTISEWSGWYKYDGFDNNNDATFVTSNGQLPWAGTYRFDESKNADPPVRVYDYNAPPTDEDGLKLLSGSDTEKIFRLTCNRFTQVVDNNGDNKAWVARTGINSLWTTTTPPYFFNPLLNRGYYGWTSYTASTTPSYNVLVSSGRNREDVPFGAAVWPDNFNLLASDRVPLRNEYSKKNNEEVFAGRPYGCAATGTAGGCNNIGYCSLDPSVYCLVQSDSNFNPNNDYAALKTCGDGGYGICVPLWKMPLSSVGGDFQNILKTIFLKSYNAFAYQNGAYLSDGLGMYDKTGTSSPDGLLGCNGDRYVDDYPPNHSATSSSFCAIYPEIGQDFKVKYNNLLISTSNTFTVAQKGVYAIEFTTTVDPEQQPLKEIYVRWGDGTYQMITGQDNHPLASDPHILYHYYRSTGSVTVQVDIKDNWGRYGSCVAGFCYESIYNNSVIY